MTPVLSDVLPSRDALGLLHQSHELLPEQRKETLLAPLARCPELEDLQPLVEPHLEQRGRAPPVLLLVPDRPELLALARHELERPPFREPHLHPLEELELAWELPLPLRVHCRVLLLRAPRAVQGRLEELEEERQLLEDVEKAVEPLA